MSNSIWAGPPPAHQFGQLFPFQKVSKLIWAGAPLTYLGNGRKKGVFKKSSHPYWWKRAKSQNASCSSIINGLELGNLHAPVLNWQSYVPRWLFDCADVLQWSQMETKSVVQPCEGHSLAWFTVWGWAVQTISNCWFICLLILLLLMIRNVSFEPAQLKSVQQGW